MKKFLLLSFFSLLFITGGFSQDTYVNIDRQAAFGSSSVDIASRTAIDSEGNRIVYGTFRDDMDFDPTGAEFILEALGAPDLFLASYNTQGNLNWAFNLGRISLNEGMRAGGLAIDSDNNITISGGFTLNVDFDPSEENNSLTAVQGLDGFLAKYNSSGEFVWAKQFGSTGFDSVSALEIDADNNHLLGIRFDGEIDFDPSMENEDLRTPVDAVDAAVVKLDVDGNYVWTYVVSPGENSESITALAINSIGEVAIGAMVNAVSTGIPVQGMLAGVLDMDGTEIWTYNFQNQGQANSISHIAFSEDEQSIYLGGRIQAVTDFDPSPNEEIISPLFADPFISKHSVTDGSLSWAKYVESSSTSDYCAGVHESNGVVFLAGSFDVLATFVPGDFNSQVPSNGASDVFVAVYDSQNGDFVDAETFGGSGSERAIDSAFKGVQGLAIAGQFSSSLTLVEGETIESEGFEDAFTADFSYLYNLSNGIGQDKTEINLYPVPAADYVNIQLQNFSSERVTVKLINIIGQTVYEKNFQSLAESIKLDLSTLDQGVYLVEISSSGSSITKRLIKQ